MGYFLKDFSKRPKYEHTGRHHRSFNCSHRISFHFHFKLFGQQLLCLRVTSSPPPSLRLRYCQNKTCRVLYYLREACCW